MTEELFSQLRTLHDVFDYVWSGYAVTIDARRQERGRDHRAATQPSRQCSAAGRAPAPMNRTVP
jgi:hypothetical protein